MYSALRLHVWSCALIAGARLGRAAGAALPGTRWLRARAGPAGAERDDGERVDRCARTVGEELEAVACRAREDLVGDHPLAVVCEDLDGGPVRSEERRVGKEC